MKVSENLKREHELSKEINNAHKRIENEIKNLKILRDEYVWVSRENVKQYILTKLEELTLDTSDDNALDLLSGMKNIINEAEFNLNGIDVLEGEDYKLMH